MHPEPHPAVAILKAPAHSKWRVQWEAGTVAGEDGPYSVNFLNESGYRAISTDRFNDPRWESGFGERIARRVEQSSVSFAGFRNVLANRELIRRSDVVLGLFEDQASVVAWANRGPTRRCSRTKVVLVMCWMAERAVTADRRTLRRYRRIVSGCDLIVYFSRNQTRVFRDLLGAAPHKLVPVSFGIDDNFFRPGTGEQTDPVVVAVGGDPSRDHDLLVEATRGSGIRTLIFSHRRGSAKVHPDVEWFEQRIDHTEYRDVLQAAQIVAVPTHAPMYPGGQTVILEAMACGRAVIATDSDAMREYIEHGVNGLLVPRGDPVALRAGLVELRNDPDLRARLGANGRRSVEARFNQRRMWSSIGTAMQAAGI